MITFVKKGHREIPRFHAVYIGHVYDNNDPDKGGKCLLRVPVVHGSAISPWAFPKNMATGVNSGFFDIPQIGANVWVTYIDGNPSRPVYECGQHTAPAESNGPQIPPDALEDYPNTSVFQTSAGHKIVWNNKTGKVTVASAGGQSVIFDDKAETATVTAPAVIVKSPAVTIGDVPGNLSSNNAAITHGDVNTFNDALNAAILAYFAEFNNLVGSNGGYANGSAQAAIAAAITTANFAKPTVPPGSTNTRIKD
jgi:hypothetical protein